jgi:hypothetical protein
VAGIEMQPDATVADLAATADALLARGVGTLFLTPPLWDPSGRDDPIRRAQAEAYWKLADTMRDAFAPADEPR